MAAIKKQQAVEQLIHAVEKAHADDLVEIYNELFPDRPTTEHEANKHPSVLVKKIIAHIHGGLEVQEVLDLWNVIFPAPRRAWFEEDSDLVHYTEETAAAGH